MKLSIFSVVPSPYQRDFFRQLADHSECDLEVRYLEAAAPDSPWAKKPLHDWEKVIEGKSLTLGKGRLRSHFHWPPPRPLSSDLTILNLPITSATTHWLIRSVETPMLFWGERHLEHSSQVKARVQDFLRSPLRCVDGFLGIGRLAAEQYASHFPEHPVWNLPYHCDLDAFRTAARENESTSIDSIRFLFAGQRIERKGYDLFLRAFEKVHQEHPEVRAVIAGRETPFGSECLNSLGSPARKAIMDAGFVQPPDLPALFAESDVFVLPSRHDGWGVVVNQALGASLPCLCSDRVGAAVDLVRHEREGLLHKAGNAEELAEHMVQILDSKIRREMATSCATRSKRVDPSRGAEKLIEIVEEVLENQE